MALFGFGADCCGWVFGCFGSLTNSVELDRSTLTATKESHSSGSGLLRVSCLGVALKAYKHKNLGCGDAEFLANFSGGAVFGALAPDVGSAASLHAAFAARAVLIGLAVGARVGTITQAGLSLGGAIVVNGTAFSRESATLLAGPRCVGANIGSGAFAVFGAALVFVIAQRKAFLWAHRTVGISTTSDGGTFWIRELLVARTGLHIVLTVALTGSPTATVAIGLTLLRANLAA